ncbi:MAG: shikimate dehydrogenase [Bacteroidales bacterium]|nr:shikimate dehydrogenase [Bacteroidales bacterium]
MREFGLIGYPLGHAYSQKYFEDKFQTLGITDAKYTLFPISEISKISNIINSHPNLIGLNVTTPYKELVIPYLDEIDSLILRLGTVNTVKITRTVDSVKTKGFNTDVYGLNKTFDNLNLPKKSKAIILGSGGSGKTTNFVLKERGIETLNVSRSPQNLQHLSYSKLTESIISQHNIIVNATPVGMYPKIDLFPDIPYKYINKNHFCIDLVYNPAQTLFLKKCADKGASVVNGLTMLYEQADKAWEIWNSTP